MGELPLEVFARLSALEFVLEVMLANSLANLRPDVSKTFKSDLISRPAYLGKNYGPIDVEVLQAYERETTAVLENLVQKVSKREAEIRAKIAQPR